MSNALLIACAIFAQTTQAEFPAFTLMMLSDGGTIRQFSPVTFIESDHQVPGALDIAIGPDGLLYVVLPAQIVAYDAAFAIHRTIDSPDPNSEFGAIAFDSRGRVVVTDSNTNSIVVFAADGSVATSFDGDGQLAGLSDIAIGNNGHMYVACESAGIVHELDASGDPVENIALPDPREVMIGTGGTLLVISQGGNKGVWAIAMRDGNSQGLKLMDAKSMCAAGLGTYCVSTADGSVQVLRSTGWSLETLYALNIQGQFAATAMTMVPQRLKFKGNWDSSDGELVQKSLVKGVVSVWPDGNQITLAYPFGETTEYRVFRGTPYGTGTGAGTVSGNSIAMIGGSAVEDGAPLVTVSTLRLAASGTFQTEYMQFDFFYRFVIGEAKGNMIAVTGGGVERLRIEIKKALN